MSSCGFLLGGALAATVAIAGPVRAQERSAPAVEFAAGALSFPDDGVVTEGMVGGAGRVYLSPRISAGPEVAFIRGDSHSHLMLTGNVTVDLLGPTASGPRAVTPFLVVGGGLFRSTETFPSGDFSSTEGAFTSGGGVRIRATDRFFVGAEARVGWETHVRVNGLVGVRLGP